MSKDDRIKALHALEAAQKAVAFLDGLECNDLVTDEKLSLYGYQIPDCVEVALRIYDR